MESAKTLAAAFSRISLQSVPRAFSLPTMCNEAGPCEQSRIQRLRYSRQFPYDSFTFAERGGRYALFCILLILTLMACIFGCLSGKRPQTQAGAVETQPAPPVRKVLDIAPFPQLTTDWCWAASAEMIMDHQGKDVSQCRQACDEFHAATCCGNPAPDECVDGAWPNFGLYKFDSRISPHVLSFDEIEKQIDGDHAVAFTWNLYKGGAHMMVIKGYQVQAGVNSVVVYDPYPPNIGSERTIPYDNWIQLPKDHTHSLTT